MLPLEVEIPATVDAAPIRSKFRTSAIVMALYVSCASLSLLKPES